MNLSIINFYEAGSFKNIIVFLNNSENICLTPVPGKGCDNKVCQNTNEMHGTE